MVDHKQPSAYPVVEVFQSQTGDGGGGAVGRGGGSGGASDAAGAVGAALGLGLGFPLAGLALRKGA